MTEVDLTDVYKIHVNKLQPFHTKSFFGEDLESYFDFHRKISSEFIIYLHLQ